MIGVAPLFANLCQTGNRVTQIVVMRTVRDTAQKLRNIVKRVAVGIPTQDLCNMAQIILIGDQIGADNFIFDDAGRGRLPIRRDVSQDHSLKRQQAFDWFFKETICQKNKQRWS